VPPSNICCARMWAGFNPIRLAFRFRPVPAAPGADASASASSCRYPSSGSLQRGMQAFYSAATQQAGQLMLTMQPTKFKASVERLACRRSWRALCSEQQHVCKAAGPVLTYWCAYQHVKHNHGQAIGILHLNASSGALSCGPPAQSRANATAGRAAAASPSAASASVHPAARRHGSRCIHHEGCTAVESQLPNSGDRQQMSAALAVQDRSWTKPTLSWRFDGYQGALPDTAKHGWPT